MRRRVLDLCLLAYPRTLRERDRDYLRDLALDLSETYGVPRQVLSLLGGGLRARIELLRRRPSTWIKRAVVACVMLAALAFAATSLIGPVAGGGARVVELERVRCVDSDRPRVSGAGRCAEERRLVAARVRAGWDCTTRRQMRSGQLDIAWSCTRG
jgi:hypothetical protein